MGTLYSLLMFTFVQELFWLLFNQRTNAFCNGFSQYQILKWNNIEENDELMDQPSDQHIATFGWFPSKNIQ